VHTCVRPRRARLRPTAYQPRPSCWCRSICSADNRLSWRVVNYLRSRFVPPKPSLCALLRGTQMQSSSAEALLIAANFPKWLREPDLHATFLYVRTPRKISVGRGLKGDSRAQHPGG
jgi:hypothetical protein